jgi:tRNA-specific 2-thiouridylase
MVAMSGGVDSSVAALLLARSGTPIAGLFMKNWEEDDAAHCPAERDAADAAAVAAQLGIALHTRNFAAEYWDSVFEQFLAEYRAGRTPNPDVLCNREIKFKTLVEHAEDLGARRIATGHYARIVEAQGQRRLLKALDSAKDQSYFLHLLTQAQLERAEFPLGEIQKSEVRRLAAEAALPTHAKKDSTGICFIGERPFRSFLARYIESEPGPIETADGTVVGRHAGIAYYTIGQREGLGIGGRRDAAEAPWYVVGKDRARKALIVAQGSDNPLLTCTRLITAAAHWIAGEPPRGTELAAKTRYRQPDQACTLQCVDDGSVLVRFAQPQRAVTPGQSVVFYRGEECLGGAVIAATDARYGGLA